MAKRITVKRTKSRRQWTKEKRKVEETSLSLNDWVVQIQKDGRRKRRCVSAIKQFKFKQILGRQQEQRLQRLSCVRFQSDVFHKVSVGWSSRCLVHLLSDELILTEAVQNFYCPLNSTPSEFNMLSYLFSQSKCPQSCFIFWARTHTSERAGICSVMCRHLLIHIYGPGCMHGDIIVLRQGSCYQILQVHFVCPKYHQTTRLI